MKTTNWDFYLTGDRSESGYLRFKIGNVRLGKENPDGLTMMKIHYITIM